VGRNELEGAYLQYTPDVFGSVTANYSLIQDIQNVTIIGSGNIYNMDPQLGTLADNGGPTLTHLPMANSLAINAGDPATMSGVGSTPQFDQRGSNFSRVVAGRIDMGAVELESVTVPSCDFDFDLDCDGADIDALQANIVTGPADPATYDLTNDGMVTIADRNEWLALAGAENLASGNPYLLGDANLDGFVNGADFVVWNTGKFTSNSAWTQGDFNSDGFVNGADYVTWNGNKFQSSDRLVNARPFDSDLSNTDDKDDSASRHEQMLDAVFATL
jgi:hypothetical protein